ncbi:DNA repair protein RecO [Corynebacterium kroppenstedtii]|uniref:DNA repair protein RecO n=1 Tax=Corynebacterium sp. PCR 32 TaxID=3351342 RepID=UPI00309FCF46
MRQNYRDRALVVRHYDYGEADRIVVLLTRDHGVVRAVAKGVRKNKSRFGGRLAPFVVVDVQLYVGRGSLASLTSAETIRSYNQLIVDSYAKYTAACAVLDVAEKFTIGDDASLCDAAADAIEDIAHSWPVGAHSSLAAATASCVRDGRQGSDGLPTLRVDKFVVQALANEGWEPQLFSCAACGEPGPHHAFSPSAGGAVCSACRPPGALSVPEGSLRMAWWLMHDCDQSVRDAWNTSGGSSEFWRIADSCHDVVVRYVHWHLGMKVRSIELMEG